MSTTEPLSLRGAGQRTFWLVAAAVAVLLAVRLGMPGARGVPRPPAVEQPRPLPRLLSQTGLYLPGGTAQVDPRNLFYVPQYPLWSDGATKRRWMRLPEGLRIDASDADRWVFPKGTRFWKEFSFGRRVETRYIERLADGSFRYAAYVWNADGSDAELAPERGVPGAAEVAAGVRHDVPGQADCRACHEGRKTPILGFGALQLSSDRDPGAPHAERVEQGAVDLRELAARELIEALAPPLIESPPRIAASSATERAALGYLFANCAGCHNAEGPLASVGLDFDQSVLWSGSAGVRSSAFQRASHFRFPDSAASPRIAPGSPASSTVVRRMKSRDAFAQMPPLGTRLVDAEGVDLIERWISQDLQSASER
jgi:hypothetical protein